MTGLEKEAQEAFYLWEEMAKSQFPSVPNIGISLTGMKDEDKKEYYTQKRIRPNGIRVNAIIEKKWEEEWQKERMYENLPTEIIRTHDCIKEECKKNGKIIFRARYVYQCDYSGKVHVCNMKDKCIYQQCTEEGFYICQISAVVLDVVHKKDNSIRTDKSHEQEDQTNNSINRNFQERKHIYAEPPPKIIQREKKEKFKDVTFEDLINDLTKSLFCNNINKERVNKRNSDSLVKKWNSFSETLIKDYTRFGIPIHVSDLDEKFEKIWLRHKNFEKVEEKNLYILKYKGICSVMWKILDDVCQKPEMNLIAYKRKFIVGFYYYIHDINSHSLLDTKIIPNLPLQGDIKNFVSDFNASTVTESLKIFKSCLITIKDSISKGKCNLYANRLSRIIKSSDGILRYLFEMFIINEE